MRRHRTDFLSLIFGLVFLLAVVWWALGRNIHIGLPVLGWSVAAGLIVLGVLGLLGALAGSRHSANRELDDERRD
jgi:hypothetical protein